MCDLKCNPKMLSRRQSATQVLWDPRFLLTFFLLSTGAFLPCNGLKSAEQSSASAPSRPPARPSGPTATAKVQRYAERVIRAYDKNGDGQLQQAEWAGMKGHPELLDTNRDGVITRDEFETYVTNFASKRQLRVVFPETAIAEEPPLLQPKSLANQLPPPKPGADNPQAAPPASAAAPAPGTSADPASAASPPAETQPPRPVARRRDTKFFVPAGRLPAGLPAWFYAQDKDGDGQITLAEFSNEVTASSLAEFKKLDRDGDGVITTDEALGRKPQIIRPKVEIPEKKPETSADAPKEAPKVDDAPKGERRRGRRE
jgi:Ca2+-binding EF-hand superfamily protein